VNFVRVKNPFPGTLIANCGHSGRKKNCNIGPVGSATQVPAAFPLAVVAAVDF
jgi:hypothetical protein